MNHVEYVTLDAGWLRRQIDATTQEANQWPEWLRASDTADAVFDKLQEALDQWQPPRATTLPTDSAARKQIPIASGCFAYFPAALAGVARISKAGNDKHNPGEPLHHSRGKSPDHGDCLLRHLVDLQDWIAAYERQETYDVGPILAEADAICWRALALSQELHEGYAGSPLAPAARVPVDCREADRMRAGDGERVIQ